MERRSRGHHRAEPCGDRLGSRLPTFFRSNIKMVAMTTEGVASVQHPRPVAMATGAKSAAAAISGVVSR